MTRFQSSFIAVAAAFLPCAFSACSFVMSEGAVKRPRLHEGMQRTNVVEVLGQPRKTETYQPPRLGASLPGTPASLRRSRVARRDEYRVSGLVQLAGDTYASDNNIYPAFFIATGGLTEIIAFPVVTGDLAAKALTRYRLLIWYDPRQKLITYERLK